MVQKARTLKRTASTELTGGAGFTYENGVTAYFLSALLNAGGAVGQPGAVVRVAVQQKARGEPLDDVIVDLELDGGERRLSLQVKRHVTISAAPGNADFRAILAECVATRAKPDFRVGIDRYGFAAEHLAAGPLRSLRRLIDWARASPAGEEFVARFSGGAAKDERELRTELRGVIAPSSDDAEADFYRHLVAEQIDLRSDSDAHAGIVDRLTSLTTAQSRMEGAALFEALCREAATGAAPGAVWTHAAVLRSAALLFPLRPAPSFAADLAILAQRNGSALEDIEASIGEAHVPRPRYQEEIRKRLAQHRIVNITGLPGCGKSAVLRGFAEAALARGPLLLLKSDALPGTDWATFATAFGLQHRSPVQLLSVIGATGTPVLVIDGIDRVRPDQRPIIRDLLRAIESEASLADWKVLVTSRDQGIEPFRTWIPPAFIRGAGIGDVSVDSFDKEESNALAEAEPALHPLLFGANDVKDIARRPFFAAVLARALASSPGQAAPGTETDLIGVWWSGGGYRVLDAAALPVRQRALVELARHGAPSLGKAIPASSLSDATIGQIAALRDDGIIRTDDDGASYSFRHDIFFEWAFYRLLLGLADTWIEAIKAAGEAPLLGRIVGLVSQFMIARPGSRWEAAYGELVSSDLRPQWQRGWLTAPPFSAHFGDSLARFDAFLAGDGYALLRKFLGWFQAEHTIPSPVVLRNPTLDADAATRIRFADALGWPSDFAAWGRAIDWLYTLADTLPVELLPGVVEAFSVWQNVASDMRNARSNKIIARCAAWLIEIEGGKYTERLSFAYGRWDALKGDKLSTFEKTLRGLVIRASGAFPEPMTALLDRIIANKRLRHDVFAELLTWSPTLAQRAPDKLVALAETELYRPLPRERLQRERDRDRRNAEARRRIRAKPAERRTADEQRYLDHIPFIGGERAPDLHEVGVDWNHGCYFPVSPLEEPFASLFAHAPNHARRLVRNLSNRAIAGWRQVHDLDPQRYGTPLPVVLAFPWGRQTFWGDRQIYLAFEGLSAAPQPVECALLALAYWAHKQLDSGAPVDDVICLVLEGHESWAAIGLAASLALEKPHASEVIMPIAACQRALHDDLARRVGESNRSIDLLGFGFLSRLKGAKAEADAYLKGRAARSRELRQLAGLFALSTDRGLRSRYRARLRRFPAALQPHFAEERNHAGRMASLKETAERWSGMGDAANYRAQTTPDDSQTMIAFEPPAPLSPEAEARLAASHRSLQEMAVRSWVQKSLADGKIADGGQLPEAVRLAQSLHADGLFTVLGDVESGSPQDVVASVAACVIRFGGDAGDLRWAWRVMAQVERMRDPGESDGVSNIPWHAGARLITALAADRRAAAPRGTSAGRLMRLCLHVNQPISRAAMAVLLNDPDDKVAWAGAWLLARLVIRHSFQRKPDGSLNRSRNDAAREDALAAALRELRSPTPAPLSQPPSDEEGEAETEGPRAGRGPDPAFAPRDAEELISALPVERWMRSDAHRALLTDYLAALCAWTAAALNSAQLDRQVRRDRRARNDMHLWPFQLGQLLARLCPLIEPAVMRARFLAPFADPADEDGLAVLSAFANGAACRHILDAAVISERALDALDLCVERVVADRAFRHGSHRAGEASGHHLPELIRTLLFVAVDDASGAARFANGVWADVPKVMGLVAPLVLRLGWSSFVMDHYLRLCERAGLVYPVDAFCEHVLEVLRDLGSDAEGWTGTTLPSRISSLIQRFADEHFPLPSERARRMLTILDLLVDLGDRRSSALQQSEAFRSLQRR